MDIPMLSNKNWGDVGVFSKVAITQRLAGHWSLCKEGGE